MKTNVNVLNFNKMYFDNKIYSEFELSIKNKKLIVDLKQNNSINWAGGDSVIVIINLLFLCFYKIHFPMCDEEQIVDFFNSGSIDSDFLGKFKSSVNSLSYCGVLNFALKVVKTYNINVDFQSLIDDYIINYEIIDVWVINNDCKYNNDDRIIYYNNIVFDYIYIYNLKVFIEFFKSDKFLEIMDFDRLKPFVNYIVDFVNSIKYPLDLIEVKTIWSNFLIFRKYLSKNIMFKDVCDKLDECLNRLLFFINKKKITSSHNGVISPFFNFFLDNHLSFSNSENNLKLEDLKVFDFLNCTQNECFNILKFIDYSLDDTTFIDVGLLSSNLKDFINFFESKLKCWLLNLDKRICDSIFSIKCTSNNKIVILGKIIREIHNIIYDITKTSDKNKAIKKLFEYCLDDDNMKNGIYFVSYTMFSMYGLNIRNDAYHGYYFLDDNNSLSFFVICAFVSLRILEVVRRSI